MTLWIPKDLYSGLETMDIASTMIKDFGVSQINNDTYNDNFNEYYDRHIRENETAFLTFCSKNGKGINSQYLIDNANKDTYVTLLSLDIDPDDPNNFTVTAAIVFKWSPTAGSAKIQAFCSNQKKQTKGAGTKLLNFFKKVLTHMGLNNIYLNPIPNAIPYYTSQRFVEAKTPKKKVYDTSSSKSTTTKSTTTKSSKSKPKTKSSKSSTKSPRSSTKSPRSTTKSPRSKSAPRSKSPPPISRPPPRKPPIKPNRIHTMTINLRAAKNWKSAKNKMSAYQALTRKNHGKSHVPTSTKKLLAKVDETVGNMKSDLRDFAQYQDIIEILERQGTKINDEEEDIVRKYLRDKYQIY